MSPITMGKAKVKGVSAAELGDRTTALSLALLSGAEELEGTAVEQARRVLDHAQERSAIAGDHTVVALAGATGSGKSSLFNALVGAQVAAIGARRPTTAKPTAAIWGESDASELLDWLRVDARHRVDPGVTAGARSPAGSGRASCDKLNGLVLLDLPDFDSRELSHRREAERILELVDMFVWVTDPQKYADARLHDEFVALMAHHDAVTLAVLNQTDRLDVGAVKVLKKDFAKLLVADGIRGASVLATSAVAGTERRAAPATCQCGCRTGRFAAATTCRRRRSGPPAAARRGRRGGRRRPPRPRRARRVARPSGRRADRPRRRQPDYRREAFAHTGFLFARWTRASRLTRSVACGSTARGPPADPRRDRGARRACRPGPVVHPGADHLDRVSGRPATRSFVREASDGLPVQWAQAVRTRSTGVREP